MMVKEEGGGGGGLCNLDWWKLGLKALIISLPYMTLYHSHGCGGGGGGVE